jgi:cell division topological specificity factor
MSLQTHLTKILHYFHRPEQSAKLAKERLQIIIAHERSETQNSNYLAALQKDILDVIGKYVKINKNDVKVELASKEGCSILELNVVLPSVAEAIS